MCSHVVRLRGCVSFGSVVACIPEGLPLTALACLSVTANRLAKKKVFIKQLSSVETLGSVTAIASDKTGTLTQNRMSVVGVWLDQLTLGASSVNTSFPIALPSLVHSVRATGMNGGLAASKDSAQTFNLLELAAVLCNRSKFADECQLTPAVAIAMERAQLLQGMDASVTLGGMRGNYPTLLGQSNTAAGMWSALESTVAHLVCSRCSHLFQVVSTSVSRSARRSKHIRTRDPHRRLRCHPPAVCRPISAM
jgi:hypothetical protein